MGEKVQLKTIGKHESEENWAVVSFHTVSEDELIEERPNPTDNKLTRQRRYVD